MTIKTSLANYPEDKFSCGKANSVCVWWIKIFLPQKVINEGTDQTVLCEEAIWSLGLIGPDRQKISA